MVFLTFKINFKDSGIPVKTIIRKNYRMYVIDKYICNML